jgi:hypothetical protein
MLVLSILFYWLNKYKKFDFLIDLVTDIDK